MDGDWNPSRLVGSRSCAQDLFLVRIHGIRSTDLADDSRTHGRFINADPDLLGQPLGDGFDTFRMEGVGMVNCDVVPAPRDDMYTHFAGNDLEGERIAANIGWCQINDCAATKSVELC